MYKKIISDTKRKARILKHFYKVALNDLKNRTDLSEKERKEHLEILLKNYYSSIHSINTNLLNTIESNKHQKDEQKISELLNSL